MRKNTLFFFVAGLLLVSCAGLKRQERPKYDMMDNLTSRFNIIHHAHELIADAEEENIRAYRPNFRELLPVFLEPTEASAISHTKLMDSVLGKTRRVINEKDRGRYLDEAYFLMGKANYLKANYYHAAEFFTYVANTYPEQPRLRQQAWIWQARSLMQLGAHSEAIPVLDSIFTHVADHRRSRGLAYATRAQYHLSRGETGEAITLLSAAVRQRGSKTDKLRWHYLLGQLLEEQALYAQAARHYRKVARSNVSYEMSFQAALHQTFIESAYSGEGQIQKLRRMLRDDKNKEFRDQIHYYIAESYLQADDIPNALTHYRHALNQNSANRHQTAQSHLSLADLYFGQKEYELARIYYDSAATVLPPDFRDVDQVRRKLLNMNSLILNFQIVEEEEQLQYLAGLDIQQRNDAIDSLIRSHYQSLLTAAKLENEQKNSRNGRNNPGFVMQQSPFDQGYSTVNINAYADNRFYFNNPDAVGMGQSAFRRQWGNRELMDNWRFSGVQQLTGGDGTMAGSPGRTALTAESAGPGGESDASAPTADTLPDSAAFAARFREDIEPRLPLDATAMAGSHQAIRQALEGNGEIYRFTLRDYPNSTLIYENLLIRYPQSAHADLWLYQLYQLYMPVDPAKAEQYQDRLLGSFPESTYAKILLDPHYFQRLEAEKLRVDAHYTKAYTHYSEGDYDEVIRIVDEEAGQAGTNAQLGYLRALAIGRTSAYPEFRAALLQLQENHPGDDLIAPLVAQHLEFLAAHPEEFESREIALEAAGGVSPRFLEEPRLTPWPQLVIHSGPVVTRGTPTGTAAGSGVGIQSLSSSAATPGRQLGGAPELARTAAQTTYRDLSLLPDTATYFFVIHVMHPAVNLAPSRFGIGQFNRSRYADSGISHQLKLVNNESQLIYIGPFQSYNDARVYETRFLPLIDDIMKVPSDSYQTFLITESVFGTLSDFGKIDDYYNFYTTQ